MHRQERWSMLLLCLVLLPAVLLPAAQKQDETTSSARKPVEGAKIFRYYCAACHGADGRGHGPASVALKDAVPDLTLISQRNGGKFSYQRVKEIIEGKEPGPARLNGRSTCERYPGCPPRCDRLARHGLDQHAHMNAQYSIFSA